MKYTKEMKLADIVRDNDKAVKVLTEVGMHCLGCPSSQVEALEDAAMIHGLDVNEILKKLEEEA